MRRIAPPAYATVASTEEPRERRIPRPHSRIERMRRTISLNVRVGRREPSVCMDCYCTGAVACGHRGDSS